jgi:hypothetical protein
MVYEASVLCTIPTGVQPTGATINETSGMMDSRKHADTFWIHEDSDPAVSNAFFYAISNTGTMRKAIRLTGISNISGGPPLYGEWEDCAYHAATNTMWVANCGNNAHTQDTFWVYSCTEPDDISGSSTVLDVPITGQYRFRFGDAPAGGWNCETMMVSPEGRLYFANKEATNLTGLYEAPAVLSTSAVNVLTKVASWPEQANLTGGDWASDNSAIYVAGGNLRGFRYSTEAPYLLLEEFTLADPVAAGNPESLAVTRDNRFLLRSSESGAATNPGAQVVRVVLPYTAPVQATKVEWWISATERLDFTAPTPAPPLAVPGGTFEDAGDAALFTPTGNPTNTITREQGAFPAYQGSWYGVLTVNAATGSMNWDSNPIDITAFDVIPQLYSGARWKTGGPHNVRMDYRFFSDAGGTVGLTPTTYTGTSTATVAGEWTQVTHTSIPKPAGAVSMRVRHVAISAVTGSALALDNIATTAIPTDPDPVDETLLLISQANAPVNDADAAVQRGDLSGFTTVTSYTDLRAALLAGDWVRVASTINCGAQLLVNSGAAVYTTVDGKVLKTYAVAGASSSSFVRTAQLTGGSGYYNEIVPSHNVYLGGLGEIGDRVGTALGGNMIAIGGDNFVMDGIRAQQFGGGSGGRYMVGVGDHWRIRRCNWVCFPGATSGAGGLRYFGGDDLMAVNNYCWAGDDTWQVVQAGALNDPFFDVDATNFKYIRCTGKSNSARYLICALQDGLTSSGSTDGPMTSSISGGRFIECDGFSGGTAVALKNTSSTGVISDISFERCSIDGSQGAGTGQPFALYIEGQSVNSRGGVQNISWIDSEIVNHHRPGMGVASGAANVDGINLIRGQLERGTNAPNTAILTFQAGVTGVVVDDTILNRRGSTANEVVDNSTGAVLNYVLIN